MSKTKSVVLLSVLVALILFFGVFSFLPEVDMGAYTYHSPINLTTKGQDVGDGIYVIYDVSRPDNVLAPGETATGDNAEKIEFDTAMKNTIEVMRKRLTAYGMGDATISYSDEKITVYLPSTSSDTVLANVLGIEGELVLSTSSSTDKKITDYTHITQTKVTYTSANNVYFVIMVFDEAGQASLKEATKTAADSAITIYFLLDGEQYTTRSTSEQFEGSVMYLQTSDKAEAYKLANILNSGAMQLTLTQKEAGYVQPQIGNTAYLWIVLGIVTLAVIIAFICVYGLQGVAVTLSLLCVITLTTIFSGLVYMNQFTLSGVLGYLIVLAIFAMSNAMIFAKAKQYASISEEPIIEKKLLIAVGKGYAHGTKAIIFAHAVAFVAGVVLWLATVGTVKSLGVVLAYGSAFSLLATLFVTKLFSWLFINICPSNDKIHHLSKEVK